MQTVQFQCGSCGRLMAVGSEHLGSQVHCPHCMEIVQAPAAAPPAAPEPPIPEPPIPEIRVPPPEVEEGSIFGGPTEDDLFTAAREPLVEMPAAPGLSPASAPASSTAIAPAPAAPGASPTAASVEFLPEKHWESASAPEESSLPPQDLSRYKHRSSMLVPMLLIFLIPYSIVCTGYIVWTLLHPPGAPFDPMQRLPDPKPGDVRRVKPEAPLPEKLKTSLHQPLRVGDTEVTPLRILLVNEDLVLHLKLRNLSRDLIYNPIPDTFAKYTDKVHPYTFLEAGTEKLYGGYVEWRKQGQKDSGEIGPGEENLTILTTYDKYRKAMPRLLHSRQLLWRVQIRRGMVEVNGKALPATAVIGVTFSPQAIDKGGAEAAQLTPLLPFLRENLIFHQSGSE